MTGAELCQMIKEEKIEDLEIAIHVPDENIKQQIYPTHREFRVVGIDTIAPSGNYVTLDIDEM